MKLQFSISELSSYLDEVFPQVVNRYRIIDLQQGYARVIQAITQENLKPRRNSFRSNDF